MIDVQNVTMVYHDSETGVSVTALENVSISLRQKEFVCLLGPSGCGKSTLLNLIAGFISPSRGQVLFENEPVSQPGPDRGVVFQEHTLFPWLTVRQNVEFGLRNRGLPPRERRDLGEANLELVGLNGFRDRYPHELSGGMRQRVALARVLALEPRALLMDEPFSALDANTRERLQDELLRIWEHHRKTVLFVTHNVEEAAYLADRVVVMGPPPESARAEVDVTVHRPRDRQSSQLREVTERLRRELIKLPCCIPPRAGESYRA